MKSHTIALEGSTYNGSVALLRGSEVISERTLGGMEGGGKGEGGRGEALMPAIAECLKETGIKREEIARIVCGAGPGSFTSLRVAGSVAKGLAVGYGVDLFAVSSLLLTLSGARPALPPGEYLSVLDAMRGEFYAARLTVGSDHVAAQVGATRLITADELVSLGGGKSGLRIIGPGQELDFHPHARGAAPILEAIVEGGPVDLALWEPEYGRLAEAQVR
ncbi:MAG: tRNA (adenosine(37)-N6)-threonylcarbamoyltransferase complex dimerization subunit type 1 TsaB, partial [Thermoanaerobaculia bacterium]